MLWWNVKQLKSRKSTTRSNAAEKLGQRQTRAALAPLVNVLSDPDPGVRKAAAEALGQIRSDEAAAALIERLKDPEPEVRRAAAKSLQEIGATSAVAALVEGLGDAAGEVAWQAAQALKSFKWEPGTEVEQAAWHVALGEFDAAIGFGADAVEPLTKATRSTTFHRCIQAIEALTQIGDAQAVKTLLDCLRNNDLSVRTAAASALGQVGDARAVEPLLRVLMDAHSGVCLAACASLSKIGDQRAVEPLLKLLEQRAPEVRAGALEALGKLRDANTVFNVVALLDDEDVHVRESAAAALGMLGDERAIEHLVLKLTDAESAVRQAAARSLRRIEPYWERSDSALRAIPGLQLAMKSKEYWVRYSAADVLNKLGRVQAKEVALFTDRDGAGQKRQAAATILLSMLGDRDGNFRQAAAEALGRLGISEAVQPLVRRLTDRDRGVQEAVAHSLETLRWQPESPAQRARQLVALERWSDASALGTDAVEAIEAALAWNDSTVRRRAVESLVQIGGPKAVAALQKIAAHAAGETREHSLAALGVLDASPLISEDAQNIAELEVLK